MWSIAKFCDNARIIARFGELTENQISVNRGGRALIEIFNFEFLVSDECWRNGLEIIVGTTGARSHFGS